jgi:hypothetical protein
MEFEWLPHCSKKVGRRVICRHNGKIKPDIVFEHLKAALLAKHPEGRYCMSPNHGIASD